MTELEQLKAERDALAAQVEAFRNLLDNVRSSEEFIVDHAIMLGVDCDLADEIDSTLAATPQQHLAEIRAEAGRAGFFKGVAWILDIDVKDISAMVAEDAANQYADKIRQEVK